MTPAQYRMARAALDWTVRRVAASAGLPLRTSAALRRGEGFSASAIARLRAAFEAEGVVFVEDSGSGPGVCFREPAKISQAGDHLKPSGPATDAVERMEAEIAADRQKPKRKS